MIKDLTVPSDLMILQIRNIVISFLALSIVLNFLIRVWSKKCTEEDIFSKMNVRNHIVKFKSLCSAFVILQVLIFIGILLSIIVFYFTENILTVAILIVLGLLLFISWIIELIATIYYEKKQQGEEF